MTGTDTAQKSDGIAHNIRIVNPTIVLLTAKGAGIWINSGQMVTTGTAGVQGSSIVGGTIKGPAMDNGKIAQGVKISGGGTGGISVTGLRLHDAAVVCNNVDAGGPAGTPSGITIDSIEVAGSNAKPANAFQMHCSSSTVRNSKVRQSEGGGG